MTVKKNYILHLIIALNIFMMKVLKGKNMMLKSLGLFMWHQQGQRRYWFYLQ